MTDTTINWGHEDRREAQLRPARRHIRLQSSLARLRSEAQVRLAGQGRAKASQDQLAQRGSGRVAQLRRRS